MQSGFPSVETPTFTGPLIPRVGHLGLTPVFLFVR